MEIPDDPDILVAYKKSRWEHYLEGTDEAPVVVEGEGPDGSLEALERAHRIHRAGVDAVIDHLDREGLTYSAAYRGEIDAPDDHDLVVTVGGDGTVLDVSHRVREAPILAINSHPDSSVGYFCAGIAERFPTLLERTLDAELPGYDLLRFQLEIDGEVTGPPVLNDVLIGHANPAAVSRYVLEIRSSEPEEQVSSGIWVSTPAGSTAAIRSAGGYVLPLGCKCIEYLVREPYPRPDEPYRHRKGIHPVDAPLCVQSRMRDGRIFVDGPHITFDFSFGTEVAFDATAPNLRVLGLHTSRRQTDG